jgi:predicted negative regulator of RcsB-dependent stress response
MGVGRAVAWTMVAMAWAWVMAPGRVMAHGNDFEMIFALTQELAKRPGDAGLLLERAEVYRAHGDLEVARRDLEAAIAAQPKFQPARVRLAMVCRDQGRLDEALRWLDEAVAAEPGQPYVRSVRSDVYRRLGRHAEALADLEAIVASKDVEPVPQLYLDRARVQLSMPKPDTNAVVAGLDQGIERMGPVPSLHLMALDLEEGSGQVDAALRRIDGLAKESSRKERWMERRGDLLARIGRVDDARRAWADAIAAIDALPERRRRTVATTELRAAIEAKLAGAKANGKSSEP